MSSSPVGGAEEPCDDLGSHTIALEAPSPGLKVVLNSEVTSNCEFIVHQPQILALDGNEGDYPTDGYESGSETAAGGVVPTLPDDEWMFGWIDEYDFFDVLMTGVSFRTSWAATPAGDLIAGFDHTATARWHREAVGGWSLEVLDVTIEQGGVGSGTLRIKDWTEFSYQGFFDPTGTQFYNRMQATPFVRHPDPNEVAPLCVFTWDARKTFPGWSQRRGCYRR